MSNQTPTNAAGKPRTVGLERGLRAPFSRQTYKNILYLALAFPLGLIYFVGLTVGVVLGVGLVVLWIGLPILHVTVLAATVASRGEAALARTLGGVNSSVPAWHPEPDMSDGLVLPGEGFLDAVNRLLTSRSSWRSLRLVLTKFGFGLLSLIALTVSFAVSGAFLTAPLLYDEPDVIIGVGGIVIDGGYAVGPWTVDTFPEALVAAGIGIVFLFGALGLLNNLAQFQAQYTTRLLHGDGARK
jgi:uncharacterized membrane protein